jgi:prepilin-type N-terminal cleavage/methylation domain-containing protein
MKVNNQKGFTLVELLVAMTIGLTLLGAVYAVYRVQAHTVKGQEYRMEAQEYARVSLDMMVREIRNLGYFPTRTACAGAGPSPGGLVAATAISIHFVYDANGLNGCTDPAEDITYTYDPNTLNITRTTTNPAATDTLTIGNVTAFQLLYYPRQTGASAPAPYCISAGIPSGCSGTLSSSLASVQRVSVSLTVKLQKTDAQFGAQQDITMNSNADLRNR